MMMLLKLTGLGLATTLLGGCSLFFVADLEAGGGELVHDGKTTPVTSVQGGGSIYVKPYALPLAVGGSLRVSGQRTDDDTDLYKSEWRDQGGGPEALIWFSEANYRPYLRGGVVFGTFTGFEPELAAEFEDETVEYAYGGYVAGLGLMHHVPQTLGKMKARYGYLVDVFYSPRVLTQHRTGNGSEREDTAGSMEMIGLRLGVYWGSGPMVVLPLGVVGAGFVLDSDGND